MKADSLLALVLTILPSLGMGPVGPRPPYYFYFRPKPIIAATELQVDRFYLGWDIMCYNYAKKLQRRGYYRWSYYWLPIDFYEPNDIAIEKMLR